MEKYLLICAKSSTVRHINYHFTQFGEVVGYLRKVFPNRIIAKDYDVLNIDLLQFIDSIINYNITKIIMYVTFENYKNSIELLKYLKKYLENLPHTLMDL